MRKFLSIGVLGLFLTSSSPVLAATSDFIYRQQGNTTQVNVTPRGAWYTGSTGTGNRQQGDRRPMHSVRPTPNPTQLAERFTSFSRRMLANFQNRIDNYRRFLTKVESRRDKLAAAGKDVTKLNTFIGTAKENLSRAQSALDTVKSELSAMTYTGNWNNITKVLHEKLTVVRKIMTELHKSMSQIVQEILILSGSKQGWDQRRPTGRQLRLDNPNTLFQGNNKRPQQGGNYGTNQ